MAYFMSMKKTVILSMVVVLAGAISYFLYFKNFRSTFSNTNNQITNSKQLALPNELAEGQGALVSVKLGSVNFLFASSIIPILKDFSPASAKVLSKDKFWLPGPCSQSSHLVVADRYFIHLDFPNQEYSTPRLQMFDLKANQLLEPLELYADYSGVSKPEGTSMGDAIAEFSVDQTTDTAYYVVRHQVVFESPDRAGTATKDSSADLFRVQLPAGRPEKIVSFDVIKTDRPPEQGILYDIPIVAYKQGPRFLVKWLTRIESMDEQSFKRTEIARSGTVDSSDINVDPNGNQALLFETQGINEPTTTMNVYKLVGTERKKLTTTVPYYQVIWSPDRTEVILKAGLSEAVILRLSDGKLTPFHTSFGKSLEPLALLSTTEALVQIPSEGREVEQPVTEDNYNVPLAVFNLTTKDIKYLNNHRSPLYLGYL